MLDFGIVPDGEIEVERERDREGETDKLERGDRRFWVIYFIG